ncbi:hypothetical protein BDR26DRAFT_918149 [Obelidium mucronatum]|nr:hypothetical protein BDR26DRAFT_918149 [Obelidium mucronatum]
MATENPPTTGPPADSDEFAFQYTCDACSKDITNVLKISCAECKGSDGEPLDLCIPCFAAGMEVKGHLRTHDYLIKEGLDWPLFDAEWTAHEELLLVDGMKVYGIGNWDQISTHIGTKTKEEVDSHYRTFYCASETWPLPVIFSPFATTSPDTFYSRLPLPKDMSKVFDKVKTRKYVHRDPNPPLKKPERSCTSGPANHEIQGYMPGREEFDHEFEQDAENPIKDMVFEDNESPEEILLKTTMLNIYNISLDRRTERKKFLKDRNIAHEFKRLQMLEKKRTKEERDLYNRIRVFSRLQTSADMDDFTEGLLREQRLRARIAELQEFRRMGVTSLSSANDYIREKNQRLSYKAAGLANPHRQHIRPAPPTHRGIQPPRLSSMASAAHPAYVPVPNRKTYTPLDISTADGFDLLVPNEQQLCSNLRLLPRAYLVIKETLLKYYAENGGLTRKQARALIKIDVHKTQQIYDLFVINGWVQFADL